MTDLKAHPAAFEKLSAFLDGLAATPHALFALVLAILNLAVIALSFGVWTVQADIDPKNIRLENGLAYVVSPIPRRPIFPFGIRGDTLSAPSVSSLRVAENGKPLGPAHAPHEDIRRRGQGAFSHWERMLIFSTPDGSDPRSNGRTYHIALTVTFHPLVQAFILFVTVFTVFLERKRLAAWLPARGDVGLAGVGAAVGIILALVAWGLVPTINADAGPPKDWPLVVSILLHIGVGTGLFASVVATGICATMLVLRRRDVAPSEAVLIGYPVALAVTVAIAAVAVVAPGGRWLGAVLLTMTWLPAAFWRPALSDLVDMGLTVARCLAPAAGFAAFMGLLWHGPTATLSASTLGDLVHSYASVHMLAEQPYPFWHLGSEGDLMPYQNMAPMTIAAALIVFPEFDGMLFLTASLAMFFGLWLALGLAAVLRVARSDPADELGGAGIAVVIALVLAGSRTPSFVVESPPMSFALPLLFSISYLALKSRGDIGLSLLTAIGGTIGTALSKVVLLLPLGLLAGVDTAIRLKDRPPSRRQMVLTAITCLAVGAYALRTVAIWGPTYLSTFVAGPDTRIWLFDYGGTDFVPVVVVLARDVGWCVLGFGVARMGTLRLTIAYWAAILANFAYPYLFHTAAICAVLLVAVGLLMQPELYRRARRPLAVGAALLLPYPLTRDWSGAQAGIIWFLCIAPIAWLAIIGGRRHDALTRWMTVRIGPAIAVAVALGLIAVGSGLAIVDSGWRQGKADVLTPAMFDIWRTVREMTPSNALIFTDLTGPEFRIARGWDSYAATGERQVFIASWVTSFRRFRIDPAARAERLSLNEKVLDGEIDPTSVPLARKYGSYFAVMQNDRWAPATFERIYRNQDLTLYRIKSRH